MMVGAQHQMADASFLRKLRKPMVEKKRRDRMNVSIDNLKAILAKSSKNPANVVKMDKAEILELAVTHLVKLQHSQKGTGVSNEMSFRAGFRACTRETIHYLNSCAVLPDPHFQSLDNHLHHVCDSMMFHNGRKMPSATSFPIQRNSSPVHDILSPLPKISPCGNSMFSPISLADMRGHVSSSSQESAFFNPANRSVSPCSVPSPALSFCSSSGSESSTSGLSLSTDTGSDSDISAEQDSSKGDIVLGHMIKEEKPWRPW